MSIDSIQISDNEALAFSQAWYNDIADLVSDNLITKTEVLKITTEKRISLKNDLAKISLNKDTKTKFKSFLEEVEKGLLVVTPVPTASSDKPKEAEKIDISELPFAPTTAFNVMRLIQLWFFPADYSQSVKWNWKDLKWWNKIRKADQAVYVYAWKLWRASEQFSDNFWFSVSGNEKYGRAMRDVLDGMKKELDAWHKQNHGLSERYQSASDAIDRMNTSFAAKDYDWMIKHFETATTKLWMNRDWRWHLRNDKIRNIKKAKIQAELQQEQKKIDTLQTRQKNSEERSKKRTKKIDELNKQITDFKNIHWFDDKLITGKDAIGHIDSHIGSLDREIHLLQNDPYNRTHEGKVSGYQSDLNLLHSDANAPIANIEASLRSNWRLLSNWNIVWDPNSVLEKAKLAYETAKNETILATKVDKPAKTIAETQAKASFDSAKNTWDSLHRILEYRRSVSLRIDKLIEEKRILSTEVKPKVKEREKLIKQNEKWIKIQEEWEKKINSKSSNLQEKSQSSQKIIDRLNELNNPNIWTKRREVLNQELTELIGNKNRDAKRLLRDLKWASKNDVTVRTRIISELRWVLDTQKSSYEKIKGRLDLVQSNIDSQRKKIQTTIADYDSKANWVGPAQLEQIREESKRAIQAQSDEINRMNETAHNDFEKAKINLSPLEYRSLIRNNKVAKTFDAMDKFVNKMESTKTAPWKIMRFGYWALVLTWVGQLGMAAAMDRKKAAIYAWDMAAWFVPFWIGWVYDVWMWMHQFVTWKHWMTGDRVERKDAIVRTAFGVLWVITFWASNVIKATAKADKAYDIAKMAMTTSKLTSHWYILYESANLGYGLWDVWESILRDPSATFNALKKNHEMPHQRDWHVFTIPWDVQSKK
ncbi:MAG: hypothetical protein ACD_4C00131G0002 [uncultured bacterium (gcode 4)]|uniref:Uncharacterized protein n=1 Tax=uncultured bacterium (gcode 4) TaxID=1234023 RepID=K2FV93_9BACT|nr:MAG: hypothetical protein ACD_4C00131G0002 [uncultured bacterium (gcode 4)]